MDYSLIVTYELYNNTTQWMKTTQDAIPTPNTNVVSLLYIYLEYNLLIIYLLQNNN